MPLHKIPDALNISCKERDIVEKTIMLLSKDLEKKDIVVGDVSTDECGTFWDTYKSIKISWKVQHEDGTWLPKSQRFLLGTNGELEKDFGKTVEIRRFWWKESEIVVGDVRD